MRPCTRITVHKARGHDQAGFTLVEAVIAMVVFIVGIMAVSNMFLIAAAQTNMANCMTAATAEATQAMDILKATPITELAEGGDLDDSIPEYSPSNFVHGVARIETRWTIENVNGALFITVRAEPVSAIGGNAGAVSFSTFRSQ